VRIAALVSLLLSSCAPRIQTIDHDGWRCVEWEVDHGALYPTVWVTCEDRHGASQMPYPTGLGSPLGITMDRARASLEIVN
jgi:hypothetical protein